MHTGLDKILLGSSYSAPILEQGSLPLGPRYCIRILGPEDTDDIVDIDHRVQQRLELINSSFAIEKKKEWIEKEQAKGNVFVGFFLDGKLVAKAGLVFNSDNIEYHGFDINREYYSGLADQFNEKGAGVIVTSIATDPDYQSQGYQSHLIKAALKYAAETRRKTLAAALVTIRNTSSGHVLAQNGLTVVTPQQHPQSDETVLVMIGNPGIERPKINTQGLVPVFSNARDIAEFTINTTNHTQAIHRAIGRKTPRIAIALPTSAFESEQAVYSSDLFLALRRAFTEGYHGIGFARPKTPPGVDSSMVPNFIIMQKKNLPYEAGNNWDASAPRAANG